MSEYSETAMIAKLRDAFEDQGLYNPDPDMVEGIYFDVVEPLVRQLREVSKGPEVVVNGKVVGHGVEGMTAALFAMMPELKPPQ